jgi:hypothetical protein
LLSPHRMIAMEPPKLRQLNYIKYQWVGMFGENPVPHF